MREDWQTVKLEDVCSFKGGGTPAKGNESFWGGHIPWVSPKDMKLQFISNSQDKITEKAIQNSSANLLPKDTLLVVVRSSILARTIPLAISRSPLTVNQDLKALLPNPELNVEFLYYALLADKKNLLSKVTRGATVHRLQSDSLKNLEVTFPTSKEVQSAILTRIMKQEQLTAKLEALYTQKLNDLTELKQSLLQQAFAGELTKEDAA
jgi:type I restriction enzyme S subunit